MQERGGSGFRQRAKLVYDGVSVEVSANLQGVPTLGCLKNDSKLDDFAPLYSNCLDMAALGRVFLRHSLDSFGTNCPPRTGKQSFLLSQPSVAGLTSCLKERHETCYHIVGTFLMLFLYPAQGTGPFFIITHVSPTEVTRLEPLRS